MPLNLKGFLERGEMELVTELEESFSQVEIYRLALESIFRWTLRRDELDDSQIVLAIKRVAYYALEDV